MPIGRLALSPRYKFLFLPTLYECDFIQTRTLLNDLFEMFGTFAYVLCVCGCLWQDYSDNRRIFTSSSSRRSYYNIDIFIAITLDESIFLEVLHFPIKNIKPRDLEATPMGGTTSKPIQ